MDQRRPTQQHQMTFAESDVPLKADTACLLVKNGSVGVEDLVHDEDTLADTLSCSSASTLKTGVTDEPLGGLIPLKYGLIIAAG